MGRTRWLVALLLILAAPGWASAQASGTLRGSVVDAATQRPLPRVQVTVQGTARGALSGEDGRFEITAVPAGRHTVRAALPGYASREQAVVMTGGGVASLSFALTAEAVQLEGLVVTALGIERQQRSLTTSVQRVEGEQLTEAREPNLVAALSGKVAGVTITNSNTPGGSSRVVIRGVNSLKGNNQPLFVVDGIPVSNAASTSGTRGYNAIDYGNAIQDINPSDIESISVLKGPNAAALYGSRAANGAIIITTKSGRRSGGAQVSASTSVTFETPLKLPDYQNQYGQGWDGRFAYADGQGGGVSDDEDASWGPRLDGRPIPQFFSPITGYAADGTPIRQPAPWVAHPNNVRDFFETGRTANTNVAFATSSERANVRLSLSRMDLEGMLPGFRMDRTNVSLHGGANVSARLRTDASLQYINSGGVNRPAQGYGGANPMWAFIWFGRQVDTRLLKQTIHNADGSQYNWNNIWNNNPYYLARENRNQDDRDRVMGNASLSYDLTSWLTGTLRAGTDWFSESRRQQYGQGLYSMQVDVGDNGGLGVDNIFRQETNADFLLRAQLPSIGGLDVEADFGGARRDNRYRGDGVWIRELAIPGTYSYTNWIDPPTPWDYRERQAVNSLYGQARFNYRDFAFLDLSGRNDWSSTLPPENNSYFYPAVSGSLVFSELTQLPLLSFGRLRAGWTRVGNDAPPYQLIDPYNFDVPFGSAPRLTASNVLRNANLKPEQTRSWEVGTELRFLSDRLGINATYYDKATTNQIVDLVISPMTGFTSRYVNAGRISGSGVELTLDATPLRYANGFEWEVTANYSRDRSYVDELYGDMETMQLDRYYNVSVEARKGERYGAVYGRKYVRDSQGNIVVNAAGVPINATSNPFDYLGNYNPDWVGSLTNTLRFGGLEVAALLDTRQGGVIYSLTSNFGRRSGVLAETAAGRCHPNPPAGSDYPKCDPSNGIIVKGVKVVAGDTVPNDIVTGARQYHWAVTGTNPIAEEFVYDASFVKLREVRIGFDVPRRFTSRWGVSSLRLALVGRNLALWSDVPHIDPETAFNAGNAQGYEYGQMPSARSFGINLSVTP